MIFFSSFIIIIISLIQANLDSKKEDNLSTKVGKILSRYLMSVNVLISFFMVIVGILTADIGLICFSLIILFVSSVFLVKTKVDRQLFLGVNLVCSLLIIVEGIVKFNF